jgi:hypothetical protein
MHEQRKIPKERYSKSSDSTSSYNSADFKVSHDPQSDCLDLTWLFSSCQFLQTAASHFLRRHFFVGPLPTAPAAHPCLAMGADGCLHDGRGALTAPSPRLPRRCCSACGRFSGIASNAVCTALMRSLFRTAISSQLCCRPRCDRAARWEPGQRVHAGRPSRSRRPCRLPDQARSLLESGSAPRRRVAAPDKR